MLLSAGITGTAQAQYLDSSFHYNGFQDSISFPPTPQSSGYLQGLALQPDGKMLAGFQLQNNVKVVRLNANGSIDAGFATGGIFTDQPAQFGSTNTQDIAVQPDGKILVLGNAVPGSQRNDIILYRLLANGTPDAGFGTAGKVVTSTPASNSFDYGNQILLRPNGKILVVGATNTQNSDDKHLLVQYNANGSLDANFGTAGIAIRNPAGKSVDAGGGLLQPDGKVVLYGSQYAGNGSVGMVARYDTTGAPDPTFNGTGYREEKIYSTGFTATAVRTAALQSTGQIVLGFSDVGHADTIYAKRLMTDGTADVSWGKSGMFKHWLGSVGSFFFVKRMIATTGDSLLFGCEAIPGQNQFDFTVLRLTPAGGLDSAWGDNGHIMGDCHKDYDNLYGMALQPDGKIVVCGSTRLNNNTTYGYPCVARFKVVPRTAPNGIFTSNYFAGTLKLYPNPAGNNVHIEGALAGDKLTLWNAMGQAVLVQEISTPILELSALPAGLYQVLVQRRGVVVGSGKLVKE